MYIKFIYSEKATKFFEISTLLFSYVVPFKSKVEISQNLVASSEYMSFYSYEYAKSWLPLDNPVWNRNVSLEIVLTNGAPFICVYPSPFRNQGPGHMYVLILWPKLVRFITMYRVVKGSSTYLLHNIRRDSILQYCNNHDDQYYGAISKKLICHKSPLLGPLQTIFLLG